MDEASIEELLGAYALDAVDGDERAEIEAHLLTCPRCRAEVASYREVASLLANGGAEAPDEIWGRIASEISPDQEQLARGGKRLIAQLPDVRRERRRKSFIYAGGIGTAAAVAIVIALLNVQVSHLNGEVHASSVGQTGIAAAVSTTLAHPHHNVYLTSATSHLSASLAIAPDENAYWLNSNLEVLPTSKTYQMWALVGKNTVVSLGVIGNNPRRFSVFRLAPNMGRLMVTVEPQGGTPAPTSSVLISAPV